MDAAKLAWPSAREEAVAIHMTIAKAILAERQRCADIILQSERLAGPIVYDQREAIMRGEI